MKCANGSTQIRTKRIFWMGSSSFLRNIFWNVEKWHLKPAVPVSALEHSVYKHQNFAKILMKSLAKLPLKKRRLRGTLKKRCNSIDECAKYFYRLTLKLNCHANFLPDLKKSFSVKWREHTFVYIPTFFIFVAFIQAVRTSTFSIFPKKFLAGTKCDFALGNLWKLKCASRLDLLLQFWIAQ